MQPELPGLRSEEQITLGGAHVDEQLLLFLGHVTQAVVAAGEVTLEAGQGLHCDALHLATLCAAAGGGQAQASDAAACTHSGRQHVLLIKHP